MKQYLSNNASYKMIYGSKIFTSKEKFTVDEIVMKLALFNINPLHRGDIIFTYNDVEYIDSFWDKYFEDICMEIIYYKQNFIINHIEDRPKRKNKKRI